MDKDIIIIASGPSITDVPAEELINYGHVIGVNESSILFPCNVAVSMDRLWMEARYEFLEYKQISTYFRKCAWKKGYMWDFLTLFDGDVHSEKMSDERGKLFGKNSGTCAINLAYQMRPKRIFLFGFDMKVNKKKEHYFYDPFDLNERKREITDKKINPNQSDSKYKYWLPMFNIIAEQCEQAGIDVYNVNQNSAIEVFPKIDWSDFEKLIMKASKK